MRLACIDDSGRILETPTVLQQDPYRLRALLMETFFQCQEILPDSVKVFQAEHNIRDVLREFKVDPERYVRPYVLDRSLEPRIRSTPRGELIRLSFDQGGPIAVFGSFYATFKAPQNARNRETLDFLSKASPESKLDLIQRSSHFPCNNSSVPGWINGIFDRLDADSHTIACILWCLGFKVPPLIFQRARVRATTWDEDGERATALSRVHHLLRHELKFDAALSKLDRIGFTRSTERVIRLDLSVAKILEQRLKGPLWEIEAVTLIFHAFQAIEEPEYVLYARTLT
ncbi:hypothetical protein DL769_003544 [Monosporascus sp. CRB-8-3]|nr:hypothetical protein DL769_003544 [Monosporascus sp. CRB-8-3]